MGASLPFFDCNARIGRPTVYRPGEPTTRDELLAEMDYAGIQRALVHHTLAAQWSPREGNAALLRDIRGHDRLLPCFVGLPGATEELAAPAEFAAEIRECHGAVRLFPKDHQYRLTVWCMGEMLTALEARGVPVIIDITQTDWENVAAILAAFPGLPLIVTNTYYRMDRYLYPLWEQHHNLYLETTTYQPFMGIEAVVSRFGPERLIFGTDYPRLESGSPIAQITYARISEADKRAIAGGTLQRLLGL